MEKIDTHMHVWRLERGDYDWMTPNLGVIYRDFGIEDAWPAAAEANVTRTILVQAAATAAETDYLLSIAAIDARVAGVTGWVDFEASDAPAQILKRAADSRIVGLRPMIADIPDPDWILQPALSPALEAMEETGLVFDGHGRADLIPVMTQLADRHRRLQIVLNHAGKPRIAANDIDQWRRDLAELAKRENISCKLSGLLTEAGDRTDDAAIGEIAEHMRDCFGPERILWGSDWPVLNLAGSYAGWAGQSGRLINQFFPGHQQAVWAGNAKRIYLSRSGA